MVFGALVGKPYGSSKYSIYRHTNHTNLTRPAQFSRNFHPQLTCSIIKQPNSWLNYGEAKNMRRNSLNMTKTHSFVLIHRP